MYPGEMFAAKVIGVDEYGQPVTVSVRLTDVGSLATIIYYPAKFNNSKSLVSTLSSV